MSRINTEKDKARMKKWQLANKEKLGLWRKNYEEKNKEKVKRRRDEKSRYITTRYAFSKRRAAKRKKEFTLSIEEYQKLIDEPCYYCNGYFGKVECAVGLDRLDSSVGYLLENVVSCCYDCNTLKGEKFTPEETKAAVEAIINIRKAKEII